MQPPDTAFRREPLAVRGSCAESVAIRVRRPWLMAPAPCVFTYLFLALVLCAGPVAHAAADDPNQTEGLTLSLQDALTLAEQRSPLVRRALKEEAVAAAGRIGAAALLPANPAVTVTLGARRDSSSSSPASQGFEGTGRIEQMFDIGGQRGLRIAEAEGNRALARLRVEVARAETRARVRAAYVTVLIARRHLADARDQEALGEQVFTSARIRFDAGAGTDVDRNLAEVERGRLTQERVYATLAVEDGLDRLRRSLGLPASRVLTLTSTLSLPPIIAETEAALLERARARRAELRVLDASAAQLDLTLARLRRERVPSPTLFFDAMSQQPGQLYLGGGLALPIPLWRRGQGEIAIANANRNLALEDRAIFEDQLAIEVQQSLRTARGLREAAERWDQQSAPAAQRNLELVTQGWRSGKFDLFRVVQTAREAADARRRLLELTGAVWDATINLDRVSGAGQ